MQFLGQRNCDEVQGYYLALPMSAHDLMSYLVKKERKSAILDDRWAANKVATVEVDWEMSLQTTTGLFGGMMSS